MTPLVPLLVFMFVAPSPAGALLFPVRPLASACTFEFAPFDGVVSLAAVSRTHPALVVVDKWDFVDMYRAFLSARKCLDFVAPPPARLKLQCNNALLSEDVNVVQFPCAGTFDACRDTHYVVVFRETNLQAGDAESFQLTFGPTLCP